MKSVLGFCPDESGFCSFETKHDRPTVQRQKLFILVQRLQKGATTMGNCPGFESAEGGFTDNTYFFSMIFNDMYEMIRPMIDFQAIKIDKKC